MKQFLLKILRLIILDPIINHLRKFSISSDYEGFTNKYFYIKFCNFPYIMVYMVTHSDKVEVNLFLNVSNDLAIRPMI